MAGFTIRVYGLIVNDNNEILLSKEYYKGINFTKFPGGGLEFGEGTREALKREIQEELKLDCVVGEHVYTSDFFVESAFAKGVQVISVYYKLKLLGEPLLEQIAVNTNQKEQFFWKKLSEMDENILTFPFDKHVVSNFL
jgi:ADP-ribose pyrophosphatase YjhB (NUDIX family)